MDAQRSLPYPPAAPVPGRDTPSIAGWSSFVMKKSVEELADAKRQEPPRPVPEVKLPPTHDVMPVTTGVSHLATADWGFMASGAGMLFGREADVTMFLTAGALGIVPRSGRVSLFDPVKNTRVEGGELSSELRGSSRGVRFGWSMDKTKPAISFYAHEQGSRTPAQIAYRQQFDLRRDVQLAGEVGSNGSAFGRAQYSGTRFDSYIYYRYRPEWRGQDSGVSVGVNLGRGIQLTGSVRVSDAIDDKSTWKMASLRIPLPGAAAVSFERSNLAADNSRSTSAIMVQLPFKRVQFMQRIQFGRTDLTRYGAPRSFDTRQSQTATHFSPASWGHFTYQQSTQWFDDEHGREWDEVSTTLRLGRGTSLQATTAFPDLLSPERLRARLTQEIGRRMSVEVQYGMLSAFQLTRRSSLDEKSTFMVTLNKSWDVRTPARGGVVRGQVVDQAQRPVSDVPVKLGPYRAVTDEGGQYQFKRVPKGDFELALDQEKLPVSYASEDVVQTVRVTTTTIRTVDFALMPLNAIRGRVYIDRNRNNGFDPGEGVAGVPVAIGTWVTASDGGGAFAFYNQPPGEYVVRLDLAHLPDTLVPASDAELEVELPADRPLTGLEFRVQPKQRPIIMQALP